MRATHVEFFKKDLEASEEVPEGCRWGLGRADLSKLSQ